MKKIIQSYIICSICILSCSKTPTNNVDETYKIIPDNTPFITGLLEATNDTVHHYPEVVVGYVSDGSFDPSYVEVKNIEGLYNPTLWTQVVRTLQRFQLTFDAEPEAKVVVTGPLNHHLQKTINFTHTSDGVFKDIHSELLLRAELEYSIKVLLPDNRAYTKRTKLPYVKTWNQPDTTLLDVIYRPYNDGTPREESNPDTYVSFNTSAEIFLTEFQSNTSEDHEILLLEENEEFMFQDRSEYLRLGSFYGVASYENNIDSLRKSWIRNLSDTSGISLEREIDWMRFSYFNSDLWSNFQLLDNWFSIKGKRMKEMYSRFEDALTSRDSTYLFDVSTIEKLGENGEVLPKSENDAIGFFAGYFSVYKKTVLVPVRNFDLDSVLTAHGY